ncbi:MAG: hypothetical protein JW729_05490 [Bacteroidales bacterium]|nr:hypothetical protein [Bacteroidales bacterium]
MKKIYLYSLSMWMIFVIVAILNCALRELYINPITGDQIGHWISSVLFICFIFILTYLFLRFWIKSYTKSELLWIGFLWLTLTVFFEFGFGHYFMHHPWEKLFADYNLLNGRVWVFVLLATFLSPYLIAKCIRK